MNVQVPAQAPGHVIINDPSLGSTTVFSGTWDDPHIGFVCDWPRKAVAIVLGHYTDRDGDRWTLIVLGSNVGWVLDKVPG